MVNYFLPIETAPKNIGAAGSFGAVLLEQLKNYPE